MSYEMSVLPGANVKHGEMTANPKNIGTMELPTRPLSPITLNDAKHRASGDFVINIHPIILEELAPEVQRAAEVNANSGVKISKAEEIKLRAEVRAHSRILASKYNRQFSHEDLVQMYKNQEAMLRTGDFKLMPETLALFLKMHGKTQDQVDKGFKQGGATYSYRSLPGNILTIAPLALVMAAAVKNDDPQAVTGLFTAYFFVNLLCAYAASQAAGYSLPRLTPLQDAEFDGSPTIAHELKEIPSYDEIISELQTVDHRVAADPELHAAVVAFQKDPDNLALQAALEKQLDRADEEAKDPKPVRQARMAIQLNRAYIEGLRVVSWLNTGKAAVTAGGGLVAAFMRIPAIAAITQLVATTIQTVGQRVLAPYDQVVLQNNFWKMIILSRKLTGEPDKDREIVNGMLQEPQDVRRAQLENLVTVAVETAQQKISDILKKVEPGIKTENFKTYCALKERVENAARFKDLQARIGPVKARANRPDGEHIGLAGQLVHAMTDGDTKDVKELMNRIADRLGVDRDGYERRIALEMILMKGDRELTSEESTEFAKLTEEHSKALIALHREEQVAVIGLGGLETMLLDATKTKQFDEEDRLVREVAEMLGIPPELYREHYLLSIDPSRHAPLSEEEQETYNNLNMLVTKAYSGLSAKQKMELQPIQDEYIEIRNDPLAMKSMRLDVSNRHLKLVRDGMKVESHKWLPRRAEGTMIYKEGLRRLGNAPEILTTSASMVGRGFQSLLGGPLGSTMAYGLISLVTNQVRGHKEDPYAYEAPSWAKALGLLPVAGLWAMHSYYAWQSSKARLEPLTAADRVSIAQGSTGSYFETSVQNWKLVRRDGMRKDPSYDERGIFRVVRKYGYDMVNLGIEAMGVMVTQSRKTAKMEDARQRAMKAIMDGQAERDGIRQQLTARQPDAKAGEQAGSVG
jgi:hypothetical protein